MPTPIVYRSTDDYAPALNGTAGSRIAVLKACLVTGFGAKSAAGWTEEYTGTNLSAFRMGSGGTAQRMYLYVDDTNTTYARIRGFVSMTSISAGVEPFPTDAQTNGGGYMVASSTADATARPWIVIATSTAFYFLSWADQSVFGRWGGQSADAGSSGQNYNHGMFFGEYEYAGTGFDYNVALISSGSQLNYNPRLGSRYHWDSGILASGMHYLARSPFATVGSHTFHKTQLAYAGGPNTSSCPIGVGTAPVNQPDAVSGNIRFTRLQVLCSAPVNSIAGYLPGFWGGLVSQAIGGANASEANNMLIDGSGELEGHQLLLLITGAGSLSGTSTGAYNAQIAIDITAWP